MESCKIPFPFHSNLKPSFHFLDSPSLSFSPHSSLVNNAGITAGLLFDWNDFESVDRKVIEVNLIGTMRMTKAMLPQLIKGRGRLIVVSSLAGKDHVPFGAAYAASKHGLYGFADSIRVELYPLDVDVITIAPGKSPFLKSP